MLATILKSPRATQTTLAIIETFTKMRRLGRSIRELAAETSDAIEYVFVKRCPATHCTIAQNFYTPKTKEWRAYARRSCAR